MKPKASLLDDTLRFLTAGPGGVIAAQRIIAVGNWDSAPIRRAARKAAADGRLIDLTYGHACRWVVFLDSGHLALLSLSTTDLTGLISLDSAESILGGNSNGRERV